MATRDPKPEDIYSGWTTTTIVPGERTRERTVWIRHERDDQYHILVIGDDGGEFARTSSNSRMTALRSAYAYIEDLMFGFGTTPNPFDPQEPGR